MKLIDKILIILILTLSFQSWTKADVIRDFEIEGISIGDSLLDYYTEDKIESSSDVFYNNDEYLDWLNNKAYK